MMGPHSLCCFWNWKQEHIPILIRRRNEQILNNKDYMKFRVALAKSKSATNSASRSVRIGAGSPIGRGEGVSKWMLSFVEVVLSGGSILIEGKLPREMSRESSVGGGRIDAELVGGGIGIGIGMGVNGFSN